MEVRAEWKRLHNEELNDLYSSPNIIRVIKSRRMRWAGNVASMGYRRRAYRVLVGNLRERDQLEKKPRRKWEHGIKIDCQNLDEGIDLIDLAQDRDKWRTLVNAVIEPSGSIKC